MDKYRWIGPVYDYLCLLYKGKAYERCRVSTMGNLSGKEQILFAGVGHGEDALFAARSGASVTVVELSEAMLKQFQKNTASMPSLPPIQAIQNDILNVTHWETYDIVVANFFLNIFDLDTMKIVLNHLHRLVKPGGSIVISDFAFPDRHRWLKGNFQKLYWYLANSIFWLLAKNPLHPIYDYRRHLADLGLTTLQVRYTALFGVHVFWSIRAMKPAEKNG